MFKMGECLSTPEEREAKLRSAAIDRELCAASKDYESTIKILVLGRCYLVRKVWVAKFKVAKMLCVFSVCFYVSSHHLQTIWLLYEDSPHSS